MVDPTGIERVHQRTQHVLLADQFLKASGTPLACKDQVAHAGPAFPLARWVVGAAARASTPPAPDVTATVAPFRAWRNSRLIVAEEPTRATMVTEGMFENVPRSIGEDLTAQGIVRWG